KNRRTFFRSRSARTGGSRAPGGARGVRARALELDRARDEPFAARSPFRAGARIARSHGGTRRGARESAGPPHREPSASRAAERALERHGAREPRSVLPSPRRRLDANVLRLVPSALGRRRSSERGTLRRSELVGGRVGRIRDGPDGASALLAPHGDRLRRVAPLSVHAATHPSARRGYAPLPTRART